MIIDPDAEFAQGRCPDGGTCHHGCHETEGHSSRCARVADLTCEPLSITGWGSKWPDEVLRRHLPGRHAMVMTVVALEQEPALFEEVISWCWVDEDGARVSPIHKKMSAVLAFLNNWNERKDRIEQSAAAAQTKYEEDKALARARGEAQPRAYEILHFENSVERINKAMNNLSRTGKPPVRLYRLINRTTVNEPTETESKMAQAMLNAEFKT